MVSFTALVSAFAAASLVAAAPAAIEKRGYTGKATFYYQNGNPGACGDYNPDSAYIVAMNHEQYSGSECGKYVKITNKSNGKTVTAKVADMCPGCSYGSIDLSRATFAAIGAYDTGVLPISWDYTSKPEDN